MLTFKQFINESTFVRDNPGGEWLKNKQEDASKSFDHHKGLRGATTGYYSGRIKLKVSHIHHLPGARGEEAFRHNSPKSRELEKDIKDPKHFNSEKHPIMIGVNHHGHPYIMEGNHRLAYAKKHGIEHIHAEVKYYNGGEDARKGFHPEDVEKMRAR